MTTVIDTVVKDIGVEVIQGNRIQLSVTDGDMRASYASEPLEYADIWVLITKLMSVARKLKGEKV